MTQYIGDLEIGNQLEHVADKFQFNCRKSNELVSIKFSFLWGVVSKSQFIILQRVSQLSAGCGPFSF